MKRIVILSDTHGLLCPEVLDYLAQADTIIHGDRGRTVPDGEGDHSP